MQLAEGDAWFAVDSASIAQGKISIADAPTVLRAGKPAFPPRDRGLPPNTEFDLIPNEAKRIKDAGAPTSGAFVIGTDVRPEGETFVKYVAPLLPNGDLFFLGDCEFETLTRPLHTYAAAHAMTALSLLLQILQHRSGALATDFFATARTTP